jgi:HK97 family phage portal protein
MLGNLFENRSVSFQSIWGSGEVWQLDTSAGQLMNTQKSLEISAFFSAISLISDTISTLPVDAYVHSGLNRVPLEPVPAWVDQPDVDMTRQGHFQQVLISLLMHGNSYTRIFRDKNGDIVNLMVLDPEKMEVTRSAVGRKLYEYKDEKKILTSNEIIHITDMVLPGKLVGTSRVEKLREGLGLNLALQQYAARFFGAGASAQGVIEFPGNLTPEQAKQLADGFDSRHKNNSRRAHRTGVLSGGAKFISTQVDPEKSQALDSRKFGVEEIARIFNIPLHMLGVPDTASYASVEQNAIQFVTHTLRPFAEKIEWAYSRLLPPNAYIKFNFGDLLRGDLESRYNAYSVAAQAGFMSINDIHALEDMQPVEDGDVYRVPLANINLTDAKLVGEQMMYDIVSKLVQAGYQPDDILSTFGLPAIPHSGVPSVQLQPVSQIDPEAPTTVYEE